MAFLAGAFLLLSGIQMTAGAEGEALRTLHRISDPDERAVAWAAVLEQWTKIRAAKTPAPGGH